MVKPLPQELISRLNIILGEDYIKTIEVLSHERKGSFRINTLVGDGIDVFKELNEKGVDIDSFEGINGVYTFDRIHEYTMKGTRAFYEGKIYLQSIASMLPVIVLAPEKYNNILDVCAAPGSKTTQIASIMENTGFITAIEQNQIRYDKLMHNIRLQGATNIEGIKMDARKYLVECTNYFDRILLDAPCSAEGRVHTENEKSYGFWSITNIRNKSELQYELIVSAFSKLKIGGVLVYSTCTLAPEENEGVISHFLRENTDATLEDIDIGLSHKSWWTTGITEFQGEKYSNEIGKTIRILPSDETEGFYLAKIQKN